MNKKGENNLRAAAGQAAQEVEGEGATPKSPMHDYINKIGDVINNLRYSYNDILFIAMDVLRAGKVKEAYELTGQAQAVIDLIVDLMNTAEDLKIKGKAQ